MHGEVWFTQWRFPLSLLTFSAGLNVQPFENQQEEDLGARNPARFLKGVVSSMSQKPSGSLRIVHLSDLHICERTLYPKLSELFSDMSARLGLQLHLPDPSSQILDETVTAVNDLDPDVICITGDITTFGDKKSFEEATTFVQRMRQRTGSDRKVVTTPGNHDVLCSQFARLLDQSGTGPWMVKKLMLRGIVKRVEDALRHAGLGKGESALANYTEFTKNVQVSVGNESIGEANGVKVRCIPFESVSMDPLWMNIGDSRPKQFTDFRKLLRNRGDSEREVLIALVHHNPMSAAEVAEPRLVNAYNCFPGASVYMKEMQNAGVDIILYGHQHVRSCCLIDFVPDTPGHLHLIGAPSANVSNGSELSGADGPGFNLIDVVDGYHGLLQTYRADTATHRLRPDDPIELVFEKERVSDLITLCMRGEVRHYRHDDTNSTELWNKMFTPGAKKVFAVGPRAETLCERYRLNTFEEILGAVSGSEIRILISDPELFDIVKGLPEEGKSKLSRIWGEKQSWENQADAALRVLRALKAWWSKLDNPFQLRVEIRSSHTLLPFGAALRYEVTGDAAAVVRLHPVGVVEDLPPAHFLLERRHNKAAFTFFENYFDELWDKGTPIAPAERH